MNTTNCPSCGKPNPDTVDICQYCGTALKRSPTVPLPPLHPGDMPVKKKTSDLESSLPGWLRDVRRASSEDDNLPESKPEEIPLPVEPVALKPEKPTPPKQKEPASPLDFLAGLAQSNDKEEDVPDWLKSIQNSMPAPAEPAPVPEPPDKKPADLLSSMESEEQAKESPAASEPDWGFGDQPATFNFDESAEAASQDTPDWLSALKAQATPGETSPAAGQVAEEQAPSGDTPDWLAALSGTGAGTAPMQPVSKQAEPQPTSSDDTPDWLSSLGGSAGVQPEQTPATNVPAEETPDWLSALSDTGAGTTSSQLESKPADLQPASSDDMPDWFASLGESDGAQPEQTPITNVPAEETPDWLSALSDTGAGTAPSQPVSKPAEPQPASSDDTADWLASLGGSGGAQPEQTPVTNVPAAETPDWLSALSDTGAGTAPSQPESKPVEQQPALGDDTLDWLSSLGESGGAQPEQIPVTNVPAAEDPDWLSGLGGDFNAEQTPASLETNEQAAIDTPDWLANLGGNELIPGEPAISEPIASESLPAADLPPWLSDLTSDSQPAEAQVEQPAPARETTPAEPVASDVPGWMTDLQGSSLTAAESLASQEPGSAEVSASADVPDWMTGLQAEKPETRQAGITESVPSDESELPSWLADAMGEKPAEKPAETIPSGKAFDTGALREFDSLGDAGELPDWMAKIGEPSEITNPVEISKETVPGQTQGQIEKPIVPGAIAASEADAVSSLQPESAFFEVSPASAEAPASPPVFGEQQNLDAILSLDMPDWLSGFTPTEAELSDATGTEKPVEDNNIRPADLPSWVQAMRPVEDVMGEKIDEKEEQQIESTGPLAGLRSVLPTQTGVPGIHKPKTYSIKLQVDETQRAQAALLENILNSESMPQVVLRQPEALVIRPLRWAIAAVLLVTVLLGALLQDIVGIPVFPAPDMPAGQSEIGLLGDSDIGAFIKTMENLPENATVLVVVDYQPGFAGEMEPASGPVISQLMSKNARLAFVSTAPMGSYMADRLLQKFTKKYAYELGTQYVNLGYLPGGAGGIQVFAELPGTTVGKDWFLGNLWEKDALKAVTIENVTKLSNFSAVIVLTDNPDTGRLWIEQAEPSLRPQPMLMVVSAQAEPLIRPYIVSGQLKGLVSGLEDGVLYESLLASPGQARSYWDAFGVAVLTAELLIVVGGVWGLVAGIRARRAKKMEQDEA